MTAASERGGWVAVALASALGCGHAPPPSSPQVRAAEAQRRNELPDDHRTLDGTWDDVRVTVNAKGGRTEAAVELRHPKLRYFYQPPQSGEAPAPPSAGKPAADSAEPSKAVPEKLRKMAPVAIDSLDIHDGELVFVDMTRPSKPEVWLSDLEVSVENLASRPGMAEGQPVLITARAKVQHTGVMTLFVTADPWSNDLNFSGRVAIEGLATNELFGLMADASELQIPKGSLDLYAMFTAKNGNVTGGVKPILKNAEIRPTKGGAFRWVKAWVADTVLGLFSDRVKGRNALATIVPIQGKLQGPKPALWSAIGGVLYNAYVSGLSAGFGGVPPRKSVPAPREPGTTASGPMTVARQSGVQGETR